EGFTRVAAFVPTEGSGASQLKLYEEGYSLVVANPWVVLVNNNDAGSEVMAHEIMHTYCAVDEDKSAKGIVANTFVCGEGAMPINWNKNPTNDDKGTTITTGFWVEKRKFMGMPNDPLYSLMGRDEKNPRWVSNQLYVGVGINLQTFPMNMVTNILTNEPSGSAYEN
ncbi:hypothetical protein KJ632_02230, partial [Patescibacteria group bacterium]|nr:hypothetical protein [Patescibacteria group bacterium]